MRKRFIAGAVCPACQQNDTLAMEKHTSGIQVQCVKCGYLMPQPEQTMQDKEQKPADRIDILQLN